MWRCFSQTCAYSSTFFRVFSTHVEVFLTRFFEALPSDLVFSTHVEVFPLTAKHKGVIGESSPRMWRCF